MKKNLFYLFMLMAVVAMPLTSCEKSNAPQQEQEKHDPTSDADQTEITGIDGLDYLQGCLLVVDEDGECLRRVIGKPLDESQPDVISVPVVDYSAAENVFLGWVAPGKDGDVLELESGYDYSLTDANGDDQGSVSFRGVEDEDGVVARMTVADGTDLKQVTEVNFVDASVWPENDIVKYEAGKIYELEDYVLTWKNGNFKAEKKSLPFYCIKGTSDNAYGVLVWLCPDNDSTQHPYAAQYMANALNYLPTMREAYEVINIQTSENDKWNNMLKEMDAKGYQWSPQSGSSATGVSEFVIGEASIPSNVIYCMDLDSPAGQLVAVSGRSYNLYRYMHIKLIPPYCMQ